MGNPFVRSVVSNRPLRELVAEAKAEVMEEIEDNREEGEEEEAAEPPMSTGTEPCQRSRISSEGDQSPTTPSPTTPIPTPRKGHEEQAAAAVVVPVVVPVAVPVAMPANAVPVAMQAAAGPATPVPMPRQNALPEAPQGDEVLSESDKSESDVSTKTSSSDSGIEDGKCTPTSDEEKVAAETPETEQPPPLALPRSIAVDTNPAAGKEEEQNGVAGTVGGATLALAAAVARATPGPASDSPAPNEIGSAVPPALSRSGLGESMRGSEGSGGSDGGAADAGSPHTNGRISKRYSDASSLASESMELGKDTISLSVRAKKKYFDTELEVLEKNQKQTIEKMETDHSSRLRDETKRIKNEQDRELHRFQEQLKHSKKELKQAADKLPRRERKESLKQSMNAFQQKKLTDEQNFVADQKSHLDTTLHKIIGDNRREIVEKERECLNKKQHLIRARGSPLDLSETGIHERHQLLKQQLKDQYFLQRHQLLKKHEQFSQQEEKRQKAERLHQQQKHENQMREMIGQCEANIRELKQLQNEKCHLLVENETQRLKSLDEKHSQQLREWKEQLKPRKQSLEDELEQRKRDQEAFFQLSEHCPNPSSTNKLSKFLPYSESSTT
ncbi:hypothetical protein CRUP_001280 [Coryphaenoides rupestris]|nr:hypothetical protein CRUP_001280 [Coryphaenoides rupestris]